MLEAADLVTLADLRAAVHESFDRSIGAPSRVAFLMYPMDGNVGNHMMWLALADYLHERGIRVAYVANRRNLRLEDLRRAVGDDPILFSGGVTLSRLWPSHADAKRVVAEAFPGNRIVALTSTMIFVDRDDELAAAATFGTHEQTFVLARDAVSASNARAVLPSSVTVVEAPDSAFALPVRAAEGEPEHPVIWLARDDVEGSGAVAPDDVHRFDWSSRFAEIAPDVDRTLRMTKRLSRVRSERLAAGFNRPINTMLVRQYERASRRILDIGHRTLDGGRVLVTDRMHPHVLAALRGQQVVLLPDRFGKNRAVFDTTSSALGSVHWADDPAAALTLARRLAGSPT